MTAKAELLKRQHDPATCDANRRKPDWARQWTQEDDEGSGEARRPAGGKR